LKRLIEKKLLQWKDKNNRKPLILNGARQVGKTYLLKQFGKENFNNCHYLDFENMKNSLENVFNGPTLDPVEIIKKLEFIVDKKIDIKNDLLIFDEIQSIPRAITSLKYFNQNLAALAVVAAGSNLGVAMSENPFPVGKVEIMTLYPLNFEEFLIGTEQVAGADFIKNYSGEPIAQLYHQKLLELLKIYFVTGGLPESIEVYKQTDSLVEVRSFQKQLLLHYQNDFSKYAGYTNSRHIDRIFTSIPRQLKAIYDGTQQKYRFKNIISKGYRKYADLADPINWLTKSGLALKTNINENPDVPLQSGIIENSFKLYLFDVGLLGVMNNLTPEKILLHNYGTYKGYFAENFILQELYSYDYSSIVTWYGRTSEVEFVAEVDDSIIPIEVKSGNNTKAKSLIAYIQKFSPDYAVKFTSNTFSFDSLKNTFNYPLYLVSKFPELSARPVRQK